MCLRNPWKLPTDSQFSTEHRIDTTALGKRKTEWYVVIIKNTPMIEITKIFQLIYDVITTYTAIGKL
jgi:hypothetical protein